MKISTKGRYGLRVLLDLAQHSVDERVPLREISERQHITIKYLEQLMTPLLRAGYVESFRGNNGGYQLLKSPKDITLGDVLRTMEGSLAPVACLENDVNNCPHCNDCLTIEVWEELSRVVDSYVDSVTLADLLKGENENCQLTPDSL